MSLGIIDRYCPRCKTEVFCSGANLSCPDCGSGTLPNGGFAGLPILPGPIATGRDTRSLYDSLEGRELRGLSIQQPYAQLIGSGKVERRTRRTHYRGAVLICSSARPCSPLHVSDFSGRNLARIIDTELVPAPRLDGHAIFVADLIDCRPISPLDYTLLKYSDGDDGIYWGWHFENVIEIEPFPIKGQLGLWKIGNDVKRLIRQVI